MTMTEQVRYTVADGVAEIALERPPVNALTVELIEDVNAALRRAGADDAVRAVILTSAFDKVFCAGLDLSMVHGATGLGMRRFLDRLYLELYDIQYRLGKPSISAVRGAARAGGMTLAVSCDVVVAGEGASFGYPEVDVGLIPALHFVHLPRQVGRHKAFELLFSAKPFSAAEAERIGLIGCVVPDDQVLDKARELARDFAAKSPTVMRIGRDAFLRANDRDYRRDIEHMAEVMCNLVETEDSKEALAAFLEKRPPRWPSAGG